MQQEATQTMSHIDSQSTADLVAALAPANLIQQAVFNYGLAPTISRDLSSHPYQIYLMGTFGATRTEEKKIVDILCAE